jgi:predicted nucleic acid-binding protein
MKEYFDTTVALSAVFSGSTRHADAAARLRAATDPFIINHGLAEVYRTLTGRLAVPPKDAARLVEDLARRFSEAPMDRASFLRVCDAMGRRSLSGPIVYDALHAEGARMSGAQKVHTYNRSHFSTVAPDLDAIQV